MKFSLRNKWINLCKQRHIQHSTQFKNNNLPGFRVSFYMSYEQCFLNTRHFQILSHVLTYGSRSIHYFLYIHDSISFHPCSQNCIRGLQSWQWLDLITAPSRPKQASRLHCCRGRGEWRVTVSPVQEEFVKRWSPRGVVAPSPGSGHWAGHKHFQTEGSLIKNRNNENDKNIARRTALPRSCKEPWLQLIIDSTTYAKDSVPAVSLLTWPPHKLAKCEVKG